MQNHHQTQPVNMLPYNINVHATLHISYAENLRKYAGFHGRHSFSNCLDFPNHLAFIVPFLV